MKKKPIHLRMLAALLALMIVPGIGATAFAEDAAPAGEPAVSEQISQESSSRNDTTKNTVSKQTDKEDSSEAKAQEADPSANKDAETETEGRRTEEDTEGIKNEGSEEGSHDVQGEGASEDGQDAAPLRSTDPKAQSVSSPALLAGANGDAEEEQQEEHEFALVFNANGGSGGPDSFSNTDASDVYHFVIPTTAPTRWSLAGSYIFRGWADTARASSAKYVPGDEIELTPGTKTIYAVWDYQLFTSTYTMYYNGNAVGVTGLPSTQRETDGRNTGHRFAIPDLIPEKDGYAFLGWSESASGEAQYMPGGMSMTVPGAGSRSATLYAVWAPPYKVETYYMQADGKYPETATKSETRITDGKAGSTVALLDEDKIPEGSYAYDAEKSVESAEVLLNGNTVLKAYFKSQFTVTYTDGVEDETIFEDQVTSGLDYGAETPAFIGAPERDHYIFAGWDKEVTASVTEDATYTAVWEPVMRTLTLDLSGGTLDGKTGSIKVEKQEGSTYVMPKPTKDGYDFLYWEGSRYNAGDSYLVEGDHSFTAVWQKQEEPASDDSTIVDDDDSSDKDSSKKTDSPKTGDETDVMTLLILMGASAALLAVLSVRRKKEDRR